MQHSIKTISATEFKKVIQAEDKKPPIIDVRTAAEVESQSLEGSAHFPLQDINCEKIKTYLLEQGHDPEQPIYMLCASGQRATRAAEQLKDDLDCPLVIIEGGIGALTAAGISIQQGSGKTISLERQVRITAGSLVVVGVILGSLLNPGFYAIAAFVGAGLVFAGITDSCAMAMLLARMPWNRAG
jgi:rhodanese-related sulfurtransferase